MPPPKMIARGTLRSPEGSKALLPSPDEGSVSRFPAQMAGSSDSAASRLRQMCATVMVMGQLLCHGGRRASGWTLVLTVVLWEESGSDVLGDLGVVAEAGDGD